MTCFLAALAMGPISPLLPLAALAYFMLMWTFWRYTVRLTDAARIACCSGVKVDFEIDTPGQSSGVIRRQNTSKPQADFSLAIFACLGVTTQCV